MSTQIKTTKGDREHIAEFDFGTDLKEAVEKYGEEVIFSSYKRSQVIAFQNAVRRMLDAGKTNEEIDQTMESWKPGVAMERTSDPIAALMSKWSKLTDEQKAEIISKLKG